MDSTLTRRMLTRRAGLVLGTAAMLSRPALAAARTLRVSHGFSIGYLPLMVMRDQQLIEAQSAALGAGPLQVEWQVQDGGNNINDALLAGALDVAGTGTPGFLVLRDRTLGRRTEVVGVAGLYSGALWLNTIDPQIRSLADYGPGKKIAVPGIKTSYAAVVLQMAAAQAFGMENYAKLDPLTVGLSHPDAYQALMSGRTEITSHMASPPFSYQELKNPAVHRVFTSRDVVGGQSILVTMARRQVAEADPALMQAVLAAQQQACTIIAQDRDAALAAYARGSGLAVPRDEMLQMLDDPETQLSVVPQGTIAYASFLAQTGVLKTRPDRWTDLFLPAVHALGGS